MTETSSAKLRSFSTKKYVCIEYPGYVKSVEKMLQTLGGEEHLSNTYFNTKRRIEIHFRPDDPYCHSVCGDLQSSRAVILKIKRKRKKKKPEDELEHSWEYEQEILGIAHKMYRFQSLMDYQYLTPTPLQNSFSSVMASNLLDEKQPLHIAPPIFSRLDAQGNYNYMSDNFSKVGSRGRPIIEGNDEDEQNSKGPTDSRIRKRRPSEAMGAIYSSKDVPREPGAKCKEAVELLCQKYTWAQDAAKELQALFDQRPIWSRSAIVFHVNSDLKRERLNKILPFFAFYWLNGPWRALWNRFGYDPRKDSGGKIYQICDFRLRDRKDGRCIPISRFKDPNIMQFPVQVQKHQKRSAAIVDYAKHLETKESPLRPEDLPYTFHADKLPNARQIIYQLCDIYDDDIRKLITENDGKEKGCNERDGWFTPEVIISMRSLIAKKVEARMEKELNDRDKKAEMEDGLQLNEEMNYSNEELLNEDEDNIEYEQTDE